MTLFPVIIPVTGAGYKVSGKDEVDHLSHSAREALRMSAERSGVGVGELLKDENGVPCPAAGIYWSLSHKPRYVAAVVSTDRVGIDIEEVKARDELLFARVASEGEWELKEKSWDTFFRYWTAKEAVLKVIGIGIGGLTACQIVSVPDENHITLSYKGHPFLVEQLRYNNHIVSVLKDNNQVEWVVLDKSEMPSTKS